MLPLDVSRSGIWRIVCASINLNDQVCGVADKVHNERPNDRLTPKMRSRHSHTPQLKPQRLLSRRHRLTKTPGDPNRSVRFETRSDARRS